MLCSVKNIDNGTRAENIAFLHSGMSYTTCSVSQLNCLNIIHSGQDKAKLKFYSSYSTAMGLLSSFHTEGALLSVLGVGGGHLYCLTDL